MLPGLRVHAPNSDPPPPPAGAGGECGGGPAQVPRIFSAHEFIVHMHFTARGSKSFMMPVFCVLVAAEMYQRGRAEDYLPKLKMYAVSWG